MSTSLEWGQQEGVAFVRIHHEEQTSRRFFSKQVAIVALIDLELDMDLYSDLKREVEDNEELEPYETAWDLQ